MAGKGPGRQDDREIRRPRFSAARASPSEVKFSSEEKVDPL